MLRPNLLFSEWKELPASIIALRFTDPNQEVTQIDDKFDFTDIKDRKRLIQFLSVFGWALHEPFMVMIPCYHLDKSIGKMLSFNVSAASGKVIEYLPAQPEEGLSLTSLKRDIDWIKRCLPDLKRKGSPLISPKEENPSDARAARKTLVNRTRFNIANIANLKETQP